MFYPKYLTHYYNYVLVFQYQSRLDFHQNLLRRKDNEMNRIQLVYTKQKKYKIFNYHQYLMWFGVNETESQILHYLQLLEHPMLYLRSMTQSLELLLAFYFILLSYS